MINNKLFQKFKNKNNLEFKRVKLKLNLKKVDEINKNKYNLSKTNIKDLEFINTNRNWNRKKKFIFDFKNLHKEIDNNYLSNSSTTNKVPNIKNVKITDIKEFLNKNIKVNSKPKLIKSKQIIKNFIKFKFKTNKFNFKSLTKKEFNSRNNLFSSNINSIQNTKEIVNFNSKYLSYKLLNNKMNFLKQFKSLKIRKFILDKKYKKIGKSIKTKMNEIFNKKSKFVI